MKVISYRKLLLALCVLTFAGGLAYAQYVTRVIINSGVNSEQKDISHGAPRFAFNGEKPILKIISGDKQPKASGFLPLPIVIVVLHADGSTPWPLAPVTLSVEYGKGGWSSTSGGNVSSSLTIAADQNGIVQAYYWMP